MSTYTYNLGICFSGIADRYPDRIALRMDSGETITCRELNRLANRIANTFLDNYFDDSRPICIEGIKSINTFAFMIACLKTGVPYCMIDPESPVERLNKIIERCSPGAIVASPSIAEILAPVAIKLQSRIISPDISEWSKPPLSRNSDNPAIQFSVTGNTPAYIMFTSGSTGFPKGAVMTHANVLNLIAWSQSTYGFTPDDIFTNVNPLYFDNSVFDFYSALFSGACLFVLKKETVTDPAKLVSAVTAAGCTSWFSVPSLLIFLLTMKAIKPDTFPSLKRIIFGGEGFPKPKLKKLFDMLGNRCDIHNVYGPTECTCICSSYEISSFDLEDMTGLPPLGFLAPNFTGLLLDENNRPVPPGKTAELWLGGPNVGKGYYNDPDRTAKSFVQNPLNDKYREILYRTGDLARIDPPTGMLHISGRADNQIKHMGFRIELEEIEAAINTIDQISESCVIHGETRGLSRIIAVVAGSVKIDEAALKLQVSRIIPSYMIPDEWIWMDNLPKNANGKIDRKLIKETYTKNKKQ
jgi:D-alanine--poly(phosphoribitol) ligase subunit 1